MWEVKMQNLDKKKFDSYLGMNNTWWIHYNHYRNAAITLINAVNEGLPIDRISLPIFFQIRHSLELGLKANILELEKINDNISKIKLDGKSHDILFLSKKLNDHFKELELEKFTPELKIEFEEYHKNLNSIVEKMSFLDRHSYSFRYPVDRKGNPVFDWSERQNVCDFLEMYKEADTFLLFTLNVLEDCGIIGYN